MAEMLLNTDTIPVSAAATAVMVRASKLGSKPSVSATVKGGIRRLKGLEGITVATVAAFTASLLMVTTLDTRAAGYNLSGLVSPNGNGILYPLGGNQFTSNGEASSGGTGVWTSLTRPSEGNWVIIVDTPSTFTSWDGMWTGSGATPHTAEWITSIGSGVPLLAQTQVSGSRIVSKLSGTPRRIRPVGSAVALTISPWAELRVGSFYLASRTSAVPAAYSSLNRNPEFQSWRAVNTGASGSLRRQILLRSPARASATALRSELDAGRDGLGVCEVIRELLLMWGLEHTEKAPAWARRAALNVLNSAMQAVWNQARDRSYWTRSTVAVSLEAGFSEAVLDQGVQNVTGPVRPAATRRPLAALGTPGELEQFADLYLDGESPGEPVAYYIERQRQAGKEPCKCTLKVAPAPAEPTELMVDVVLEAPRFTWNDVDRCPRVPMPHRYVESLLLPIARYQAMSGHLAVAPERRAQIEAEYAAARLGLELADPLPGKSGDNTNLREEARV